MWRAAPRVANMFAVLHNPEYIGRLWPILQVQVVHTGTSPSDAPLQIQRVKPPLAGAGCVHCWKEMEYPPVLGSCTVLKLSKDRPKLPRMLLPRSLSLPITSSFCCSLCAITGPCTDEL
eukprot:scaffold2871_cov381-Prasinococcus_capsulatus_cf.AAC.9